MASASSAGEQAAPLQAPHVGLGAGHVVGRQPDVERQAGGERHQAVGRLRVEPPLPEGHAPAVGAASRSAAAASDRTWRLAHVCTPRPHRRTKPAASSWLKVSAAS